MRTAALAILEYLIGFIALAFFAYLAFGRGQTTDETFVFAFKASSLLAIVELAFLLARTAPANRLILGANLWLIAGGAAAFTEQWWWLRGYQQFGEGSLFLTILLVGVVSTLFTPSGFIAKLGPSVSVQRSSLPLFCRRRLRTGCLCLLPRQCQVCRRHTRHRALVAQSFAKAQAAKW
jgi:hypothetical protein